MSSMKTILCTVGSVALYVLDLLIFADRAGPMSRNKGRFETRRCYLVYIVLFHILCGQQSTTLSSVY